MVTLANGGAWLVNGAEIIADGPKAQAELAAKTGRTVSKEEAKKQTIAYGILENHNTSGNMEKLKIKFDKLTSHDITFVGIIQTARASGLTKFPIPYVLTNCHNSLCAVGGTINEDDHLFGLTCAKKYGGVYVPPHQAVIHQFAREMLAGGGFENICAAADILKGSYIGNQEFTLSVYPASMPIYMELIKNGCAATILETGAVMKTAFCGPCFGAGDTPANNAFSIRHSTRNFPNREGSKLQNGQIASVALMDARSIAATAANQGRLTAATEFDGPIGKYQYHFDSKIYQNRVFDSHGVADPSVEIHFGPNIKDWPTMCALPENLVLQVVSEIHDPVTTTDELIPSGETSSYRSNPLGLAEFTLSRKDPAYVGLAKEIHKAQEALMDGKDPVTVKPELAEIMDAIHVQFPQAANDNLGFGSTIFAVKPGDGSAREQAASCQKVLGGWANIANEYATKRYRSNLINWGMLPFVIPDGDLPFTNHDYLFFPGIRKAVEEKAAEITGYVVNANGLKPFTVTLGELTDEERQIILKGCLINYNRVEK